MNRDDIIKLAGHREVPPWVMKLVVDCVAAERERMRWDGIHTCGPTCDNKFCVAVREAVAAERQRCERICYDMIERSGYSGAEHAGFENGCIACAEAVADEMHQLLRRHEGS
jgi:hypothetical protein